jgi:3-oxoacyl-[acyl-carrier protein] reductase
MEIRFDNRVVVVTGAGGGIGRALCRRFCASGGTVVALDIREDRLEALRSAFAEEQREVEVHCADLTCEEAVASTFGGIAKQHGGVHVLVNNAGLSLSSTALKAMSTADWDHVVEANLKTAFLCSRAAVRSMLRARHGRIMNISSIVSFGGDDPPLTELAYVAAKGALNAFTRGLARQVGPRGITVNAILPGLIRTPMTDALLQSEVGDLITDSWIAACPCRRLGEPDDVAALAAFLASDQANFITGQLIGVDGGYL